MIGSKGPNISSFMMAESRGTSRYIVGAIFLRYDEETICGQIIMSMMVTSSLLELVM